MARPARPDGMAAALADIPTGAAVAGWAIAIAITALLLPARTGLLVLAAAALTGMIFARLARTRLGGHTGDILGAAELTAECAVLSLLAIP
jgi:adenosylcobinamide-GDP ribazoletransferase